MLPWNVDKILFTEIFGYQYSVQLGLILLLLLTDVLPVVELLSSGGGAQRSFQMGNNLIAWEIPAGSSLCELRAILLPDLSVPASSLNPGWFPRFL